MGNREVTTIEIKSVTRKWFRKLVVYTELDTYDQVLQRIKFVLEREVDDPHVVNIATFLKPFGAKPSSPSPPSFATSIELKTETRHWLRRLVHALGDDGCNGYNDLLMWYFRPYLKQQARSRKMEKIATYLATCCGGI